ncbi:hypothetical protein [Cytobacillus purgationiresistens]|uniref:Uncharacterized protein n=1 Tax=Cytobacillus purgationiresistens TaxID=863449 RepID=A0ABU0AHB3_9BACI|nr:hypothetical protein [Cytobacillus purgationiresistens]MDQ0270655.1 hypothetical protein [Cytobacillus purgationiresistens]
MIRRIPPGCQHNRNHFFKTSGQPDAQREANVKISGLTALM